MLICSSRYKDPKVLTEAILALSIHHNPFADGFLDSSTLQPRPLNPPILDTESSLHSAPAQASSAQQSSARKRPKLQQDDRSSSSAGAASSSPSSSPAAAAGMLQNTQQRPTAWKASARRRQIHVEGLARLARNHPWLCLFDVPIAEACGFRLKDLFSRLVEAAGGRDEEEEEEEYPDLNSLSYRTTSVSPFFFPRHHPDEFLSIMA